MVAQTKPAVQLDTSSLFERQQESRFLEEMLESCWEGNGEFVLIQGPLGSGKSSLLRVLREGASNAGFTVLQARGSEFESGHSYGIVRQMLEHWFASADPVERGGLLSGPASLALSLFEYHEGLLPAWSDTSEEIHVHHGLRHLLANLSEQGPLLLLLDDLHLADSASVRFLRHLAHHLADRRILCCVTAPMSAAGGVDRRTNTETVQDFLAPAAPRTLVLRPLSENGVRAYLSAAVPDPLAHESARACYAATAGNPFLLRELVGELGDVRRAGRSAEPARVAGIGPRNIARVVLRWVHHSPRRRVLGAVPCAHALAVLGVSDSIDQLALVAGLDRADAAEAAEVLQAAGIVEREGPLRFVAPIIRNAIYHDMTHALRFRAHYAAAQTLADQGAPPERIAEHLLHVPPHTDGRAAEILVAAGRAALAEGDSSLALSLARRARRENIHERTLPLLLAVLGEAEYRTGQPQAVATLRQAMDVTGDPADRASIALLLGAALAAAARYDEADEVYGTAYGEVCASQPVLARRLRSEQSNLGRALPGTRGVVAELTRELGVDVHSDDPDREPGTVRGLALRATRALLGGETSARVLQLVKQAMTRDISVREPDVGTRVPWFLAYCLSFCGRFPAAGKVLDNAIQQAETLGIDSGDLRALRSYVNVNRGMLAEAENDATATLARESCDAPALGWPLAVLALTDILLLRNQLSAAAAMLENHGSWEGIHTHQFELLPLTIARRHLLAARGDHEAIVGDCRRVLAMLQEMDSDSPALTPVPCIAEGLAALGQTEEAHRLAAAHLAAARKFGAPYLVARSLRAYARTVQGSDAIEALEEAVHLLDGSSAVIDRCLSLAQLGTALKANGQSAQARRRLRAADEMAEAVGATAVSGQIRRELAAMGVRLRPPTRTGASGLTPREHRVSALAAEGKRNHEIARILFVTVKTVEWHLSQVYRKLGIASRNELSKVLSHG